VKGLKIFQNKDPKNNVRSVNDLLESLDNQTSDQSVNEKQKDSDVRPDLVIKLQNYIYELYEMLAAEVGSGNAGAKSNLNKMRLGIKNSSFAEWIEKDKLDKYKIGDGRLSKIACDEVKVLPIAITSRGGMSEGTYKTFKRIVDIVNKA